MLLNVCVVDMLMTRWLNRPRFCLDWRACKLSGRVRCCCLSPLSRWAPTVCIYVWQPRCAQVHMGDTDHPQGSGKAFQRWTWMKWLNEESALLFTERLSASHPYPTLHRHTHACMHAEIARTAFWSQSLWSVIWPLHFSLWQIVRLQTVLQQNSIYNWDMM